MAESRLQRWARKKAEAGTGAELTPPSAPAASATPEEQELASNEALPEHEVLAKCNLPDPDAIALGTDITGFMRKEIPELLRRRALRALWKSNPVLAVLDGLNDYDEDFSNAATTVNGVQTLYRVGQGMFDKTARADQRLDERPDKQVAEQTEDQTLGQAEVEQVPEIAPEQAAENEAERSGLVNTVEPSHNEHVETVTSRAEAEPAPRYRPRMRFDQF